MAMAVDDRRHEVFAGHVDIDGTRGFDETAIAHDIHDPIPLDDDGHVLPWRPPGAVDDRGIVEDCVGDLLRKGAAGHDEGK